MIQQMYKDGHATKDDYSNALTAYQAISLSDQRDKAAACEKQYKYYEPVNAGRAVCSDHITK